MRSSESVAKDLAYLSEFADSPQNVATLTLVAEMLFDIREVLLDMAEHQGVDVDSFFVEAQDKEDLQPEVDGADISEEDLAESDELSVTSGVSIESPEWLEERKAELRMGFDTSLDFAGGEGSSN